jgi:hypothetical protein
VDLETLLVALYVLVEDWWKDNRSRARRGPGRPVSLSDAELLTLAILSQWPRWRSERDFCRFADAHLRPYFPNLLSQSQLNRRIRAVEPELKVLQRDLASRVLSDGSEVYHVLDTTLIPAVVRVRACRKGLFAGQASFGRNVSKTEWVYGFKVALSVTPDGVVTSFGLAPANCDERPAGSASWLPMVTTVSWPTRASPPSNGKGTGWRTTGHWWLPPRRKAPNVPGRRRVADGRPENARS